MKGGAGVAWKRPHRGNPGPRHVGILTHQRLWHLGTKTRSVLPRLQTPALTGPQSRWVRSSAQGWSWPNAIIYTRGSQTTEAPGTAGSGRFQSGWGGGCFPAACARCRGWNKLGQEEQVAGPLGGDEAVTGPQSQRI